MIDKIKTEEDFSRELYDGKMDHWRERCVAIIRAAMDQAYAQGQMDMQDRAAISADDKIAFYAGLKGSFTSGVGETIRALPIIERVEEE